jgi:hypothetical protein
MCVRTHVCVPDADDPRDEVRDPTGVFECGTWVYLPRARGLVSWRCSVGSEDAHPEVLGGHFYWVEKKPGFSAWEK